MITKERLEELIEQGATIWNVWTDNCVVTKVRLKNGYYIMNNKLYEHKLSKYPFECWYIENLFEIEKDANDFLEWHKEFGCIERTERLELPTWEEFRVIGSFAFYDYKHNPISMMICLDPVNVAPCNDCIYIADKKNEYFCKPKTKENYILACRKAKELFLGEKK